MTITDSAVSVLDRRGGIQSPASGPFSRTHTRGLGGPCVQLVDAVGVVSPNTFVGETTAAWIRSLGYDATTMEVVGLAVRRALPKVLVVHGAQTLAQLPMAARQWTQIIALVDGADTATATAEAPVILNFPNASDQIRGALAQILGKAPGARVALSRREQEVLATYVLGETVKETAATHFIAECTVRTHYRRVTRRYDEVGRPVANKAQLLLAMVADGWVTLDGKLGHLAEE
ncbi:MAG: LuxR C-terminal-related transcriptional regulator [Gordonia sp. (in: high G+C Gram-positive bacteria)]|uniref:LuxR C-terminal-related transcriptional regulator n=1 Tax=Gordonia sp. (in: high G+C Gram-positive bacteria) TaxID=84139 RepID=UPI003C708E61